MVGAVKTMELWRLPNYRPLFPIYLPQQFTLKTASAVFLYCNSSILTTKMSWQKRDFQSQKRRYPKVSSKRHEKIEKIFFFAWDVRNESGSKANFNTRNLLPGGGWRAEDGLPKRPPQSHLPSELPENTNLRGSITVWLTSCLFCLDSAALLMLN